MSLPGGIVTLGMGWDMLKGGKPVDLDTSCVGVSDRGCAAQTAHLRCLS